MADLKLSQGKAGLIKDKKTVDFKVLLPLKLFKVLVGLRSQFQYSTSNFTGITKPSCIKNFHKNMHMKSYPKNTGQDWDQIKDNRLFSPWDAFSLVHMSDITHKHKHKQRKQSMTSPLGLAKKKQREFYFVSIFVLLLAYAWTLLMIMLMTIVMSQAWLHSSVFPFVLPLCLCLCLCYRVNQAIPVLRSSITTRNGCEMAQTLQACQHYCPLRNCRQHHRSFGIKLWL